MKMSIDVQIENVNAWKHVSAIHSRSFNRIQMAIRTQTRSVVIVLDECGKHIKQREKWQENQLNFTDVYKSHFTEYYCLVEWFYKHFKRVCQSCSIIARFHLLTLLDCSYHELHFSGLLVKIQTGSSDEEFCIKTQMGVSENRIRMCFPMQAIDFFCSRKNELSFDSVSL